MAKKIVMPQGGHDIKFGTIVRWLKKEGDAVKKDELLCEVETEKAVFEVTAFRSGVLLTILKKDGEEAEILSAIGYIGDAGEVIVFEKEIASEAPAAVGSVHKHQVDNQKLPDDKVRISPKARKLARDHNLDILQLQSSRSDGKITTKDVQETISVQSSLTAKFDITGGHEVMIGRIKSITAKRLSQSWNQAPHFFVSVSVDVTDILEFREELNRDAADFKISINDLIIKAAALSLKEFPQINASYKDENTIIEWDEINIGVATATDQGLLVPVLKNVDQLPLSEISRQVKEITHAGREGKINPNVQSRFTISNLGMHQIDQFTAIINPPESAILAVASIMKRPVAAGDNEVVVRNIMKMTLSLDHRVGDGVLAANFINRIKELLEYPKENNQFS